MKRESINYFIVGSFVLIILVVLFFVLHRVTGSIGPTDKYYVIYKNVGGIKYGTSVLYEGYQVGQVEDIEPLRDSGLTSYRITLSVIRDWKIPNDSVASIVASGLLSAISINIQEGSSTTAYLPGETLEGREASNIFAAVNNVAAELNELSKEGLKPFIDNLNSHINNLATELHILITRDVRPVIKKIDRELDGKVIEDMKILGDKLNESADRLLTLLNNENQENVANFLENIDSASSNLNDLLLRIEDTRIALNDILNDIDTLVENNEGNIDSSISNLQKSLDIIAQHITAIVHHMEGSTRNIHELSRRVRENPGILLRSSPQLEEVE